MDTALERCRSCRSNVVLAFTDFIRSNGDLQLMLAKRLDSHLGHQSAGEKQ